MFLRKQEIIFNYGMEIEKPWTVPHFTKNKATIGNTSLKKQKKELERSLHKWNMLVASEKLLSKEWAIHKF